MSKVCPNCGKEKPTTAFYRSSKYSDGLQFWCKACQRHARSGLEVPRNHGESRTPLYRHWKALRWRCSPKNTRHRRWYFDRGIIVCAEWEDWSAFKAWAEANGYQPGLTIDRIDNDQGYCPDNCQWITLAENVSKARRSARKAVVVEGGDGP